MSQKSDNIDGKIISVIPLIPEYYDEGSFVNEKPLVKQISKLLKPTQWLRIEPEPREYNTKINYKQPVVDIKPTGIWASKGEWFMDKDKYLTLLEVDYSRILVLITKQDYLDFENKYCKYESISGITKKLKIKTKKSTNKHNKLVCSFAINWAKVANDYDGIAMIPNPAPYFPYDKNNLESHYSHIWLKSFDVSSLIIWRQNSNTPITKYKSLGKIQDIYDKASKNKKSFNKTLLETIVMGQKTFQHILKN